jgi:hypothetical protein
MIRRLTAAPNPERAFGGTILILSRSFLLVLLLSCGFPAPLWSQTGLTITARKLLKTKYGCLGRWSLKRSHGGVILSRDEALCLYLDGPKTNDENDVIHGTRH